MQYRIEDARPWHAGALARRLAPELRRRAAEHRIDLRTLLRHHLVRSMYAKAAVIVDVGVVALWGLEGGLLNSELLIWLAVAPDMAAYPTIAGRAACREMAAMLAQGADLRSFVRADDGRARRFVECMGFAAVNRTDTPAGHIAVLRRAGC